MFTTLSCEEKMDQIMRNNAASGHEIVPYEHAKLSKKDALIWMKLTTWVHILKL